MSLTVFMLLSAVLALAVGVLASLLLRSLMMAQHRLEDRPQGRQPDADAPPKLAPATALIQTEEPHNIWKDH